MKVQNEFPYISRNELTISSQQNEYKTQLLALFFINLDHESEQLGVPLQYKGTKSSHIAISNQELVAV